MDTQNNPSEKIDNYYNRCNLKKKKNLALSVSSLFLNFTKYYFCMKGKKIAWHLQFLNQQNHAAYHNIGSMLVEGTALKHTGETTGKLNLKQIY